MADKLQKIVAGDSRITTPYQDLGDGSYAQTVVGPDISVATAITGQITVVTAGTAVQGPDVPLYNGVWIMSHPSNVGNVAYGNTGSNTVSMTTGIVIEKGKFGPILQVSNLNQLWFNAATSGDKFCWAKG